MSVSSGARKNALPTNGGERALRNAVCAGIVAFYTAFCFIPILQALMGSFHQWNPLNDQYVSVGFANYSYALKDELFWSSMLNNVLFTAVVVFFRVAIGFILAMLVAKVVRFRDVFRTVFFLPVIASLVAVSYVWRLMYDPNMGLINAALARLGIHGRNWLLDPDTSLLSIMAMTVWKDSGYAMVIFLAGILSLPKDVYEAADIDGAGSFAVFSRITVPLLNRTTVFIVITSLITYLQTFAQILVMTNGGPGTKTYLTTFLLYDEAFVKYNFGYAASISFLLFIVIVAFTVLQFKTMKGMGGSEE